jgi:hypothetical protein
MRTGAVLVELSEDLAERLDHLVVAEGRSAPELLALGLQIVIGLRASARSVLVWMGNEGTPEERSALLRAMGRQVLHVQNEVMVARAAAGLSAAEVEEFISEAEMAIQEHAPYRARLAEPEEFG